MFKFMVLCSVLLSTTIISTVFAQQQQQKYTTPVPILKQINRHNEDGSYSYGYEGADGSFKIETKYPNGEVYGKYGYVDDTGKLREVEYGASKRGFEPQGNDINVPPPTLQNNNPNPLGPNEEDDGQYREDPNYYNKYKSQKPLPASNFRLDNVPNQHRYTSATPAPYRPQPQPQPQPPQQPYYNNPTPQPYRQQYVPPPQPYVPPQQPYVPPQQPYVPEPQPQHRFQSQPQPAYVPPPQNYYSNVNVPTLHHPALRNLDLYTGSYSIDYTGRRR